MMEDILEIFGKIFGLTPDATIGAIRERGRKIHSQITRDLLFYLIPMVVIEYFLNVAGYKGINLFIGLFLFVATLLVATKPEVVLALLGMSALAGTINSKKVPASAEPGTEVRPETDAEKVGGIISKYLDIVGTVLLWLSISSMFLGTLPFANNRGAILLLLSGISVVKLAAWKWDFGLTLYKKVIYWYAMGCFLYAVCLILIPKGTFSNSTALGRMFTPIGVFTRSKAQSSNTYWITKDTAIYDCTKNGCKEIGLHYKKTTRVISLGKSFDLNGATYEKFSLPDPATGQPGMYTGFVPDGNFMDTKPNANPASGKISGKKSKWSLYDSLNFADGRPGNGRNTWLTPGTYKFPKGLVYTLNDGPELISGKSITVQKLSLLVIRKGEGIKEVTILKQGGK